MINCIKSLYLPKNQTNFTLEELNSLMKQKKIPKDEYTLEDIGKLCGLTRERVRQIESSAMRTLKYLLSKPENRIVREELSQYFFGGIYNETTSDMHYLLNEMSSAFSKTKSY